ncbi:PTS ascorbate transporter subunit IIC [Psittacicella melopsittaci]|uniref:Ascorbate-specific PTS system EIIC component n=1 Tax=Psittacicella melopsittaci TaxID=2028576 RepID=A0A3A1Y934_9GAMM|nr:PTS ascorbate transporter subunit IIC [Psittacicella melopsittaci]RIY34061.1 PTS ascorbate transporter subunit IIC [Psittacicella melopsittaci]
MLTFLTDILSQPAFLMGAIAFIGLLCLKAPANKLLTGTIKPILGYLMLGAGANVIVSQLTPLGQIIEAGFHIKGVVPNNEAIVSIAQQVLGVETMSILLLGFIFNLAIAKFTKYKYIFLTGHHTFFMACLMSAVLQAMGLKGWELVALGGFFLGAWSAISPAIGQRYTKVVSDDDGIAMGHFGSLQYYLAAWIGKTFGNRENNFTNVKLSDKLAFLRDTTVTTGIVMVIIFLFVSIVAGSEYMKTISEQNLVIYSIIAGLTFAVGVAIVYNGVKLILSDLVPAFQGISEKLIPDSIPAVDCAVFFTYSQTAVVVGFISSFAGGLIGMGLLGILSLPLIIPGMVPHFFCGATAGIYGDRLGGKIGCIVGAFVGGLLLAFLPAFLLPALGDLGFASTTFSDVDFIIWGISLYEVHEWFGRVGVYVLALVILVALIIPSFIKSVRVVGDTLPYEECLPKDKNK